LLQSFSGAAQRLPIARRLLAAGILALWLVAPAAQCGVLFTNLVSFAGTDGWLPYGGLVQGTDGSFYGTTSTDTTNGSGTVFNVTTNGTLTSLYLFTATDPSAGTNADGANPSASLVQGADGNFYGTTQNGGANNSGTVFQMTPGGTLTSLYSFTAIDPSTGTNADGVNPSASLVQGPDGNFYGTTQYGGTNGNGAFGYGTVFQLTPQGALTTLYSFGAVLDGSDTPVDGANPYAGLVLGRDGQFYGTTLLGGANNLGAIYRLTVPMASALRLVSNTETNLTFNWSAVAGLKYLVQYSTNLSKTNWSNLGGTNTATNGIMTTTDSFGSGQNKFYRVVLLP
jgi:uncharacterized repeat protein (TIGR03803 family)